MEYQEILYSTANHVATITLNRPDRLNAWTSVMEQEVRSALEASDKDSAVRATIITGAGRGFCAGADMNTLSNTVGKKEAETPQAGHEQPVDTTLESNYQQRFSYLLALKKPVIAAINGPMAGIGLCLSLFCDLRYMSESAKLTTAFAKRGLIAEHGVSWMLPRLIGTMNALDLLYSSRIVLPHEAERMGLVRTLPSEGFLEQVQKTISELVTLSSPRSISIMKRQVFDALFQSLSEAWFVADREMKQSFSSEDFKEGVAHFLEKRPPHFTGK